MAISGENTSLGFTREAAMKGLHGDFSRIVQEAEIQQVAPADEPGFLGQRIACFCPGGINRLNASGDKEIVAFSVIDLAPAEDGFRSLVVFDDDIHVDRRAEGVLGDFLIAFPFRMSQRA